MAALAVTTLLGCVLGAVAAPTQTVSLHMPSVQPKVPDTYLCHGMKMDSSETYITGFVPHANKDIAHHMLLYGCLEPGASKPAWNCGEMAGDGGFDSAPTCKTGAKILYAWAMDAPMLTLPPDVAFEIGGKTGIKHLVLQVHYKNVTSFLPPIEDTDSSGMNLITQKTKLPRQAGVYLMGTGGKIKAKSTVYMDTACEFTDDITIHPFAYRTHAHTLGRVVSGYRIRGNTWTEIGRMSPQKPQMFYNVTNPGMTVQKGDILAARCTMVNDLSHPVSIGSTQKDEMCNFYIMYFVDGDRIMSNNYCFSPGPPSWSWRTEAEELSLSTMPASVSLVPGEKQPLQETSEGDDQESLKAILSGLPPRDLGQLEELYAEMAADDARDGARDDEYYYNNNRY